MIRRVLLLVTLAVSLALLILDARAQTIFERLVMPGELIQGHAKLEKDCGNCHVSFAKKSLSRRCLDCHKEIASDISRKSGAHGKRKDVSAHECSHCHQDHKGRKADIADLDPQTFNHGLTDFPLQGAHSAVACQSCHVPGKKYREASSECIGCHKKDEPHQGRLGDGCQTCHDVVRWLSTKAFDHGKTAFPLVGKHKDVTCTACHAAQQWKGIAKGCVECHRIEDAHSGRYGPKCESCHVPKAWKPATFNHDTATKFPLRGEHRKVLCDSCHTGELYRDKLAVGCASCHKKDDAHKGRLGAKCETCHNETGWRQKVTFDHDLTRFPLIGLHAAVSCEACHKNQSFKDTPRACTNCHEDVHHEGRLGTSCDRCHNPNGWILWQFDHGKETKFPLTGRHASVPCHNCHSQLHVRVPTLPMDCYSCHSGDDAHQGAFGRVCSACHTTESFSGTVRRR
jgi:hypothetical protein